MNWGRKIAIVYSSFALFMIVMVVIISQQKMELDSENYYELELKHQSKIDASNNYVSLNSQVQFNEDCANPNIIIPEEILTNLKNGEITFQRKGDKSLDFKFIINKNTNIQIPTQKIKQGQYKVSMDWTDGTKNYYKEEIIKY